jgi:hypothetical protein
MKQKKLRSEHCPVCGATLLSAVGYDPKYGAFDGRRCPNGCDLAAKFGGHHASARIRNR